MTFSLAAPNRLNSFQPDSHHDHVMNDRCQHNFSFSDDITTSYMFRYALKCFLIISCKHMLTRYSNIRVCLKTIQTAAYICPISYFVIQNILSERYIVARRLKLGFHIRGKRKRHAAAACRCGMRYANDMMSCKHMLTRYSNTRICLKTI